MMAYQYFPTNYQPYQQYQQPYYQPAQQQAQPQTGIIWVSGAQEAAMYPVAPNNAVALWEQSGKSIYLKSADATGKPTIRVYDLAERVKNDSDATSATDVKTPDYATKEELGALMGAVKGIDGTLASVRAEIDTLKADMYGLAGKRKVKKTEADDE